MNYFWFIIGQYYYKCYHEAAIESFIGDINSFFGQHLETGIKPIQGVLPYMFL